MASSPAGTAASPSPSRSAARFIEIASSAGLPGESSGNSLRVMGSSAWLSDRVRPLCTATSITPDQRQSPPASRSRSVTASLPPVRSAWVRSGRCP